MTTTTDIAALISYAERTSDLALIHGARLAAKGDTDALAWCETQIEMMGLMGEVWR